MPRPLRKPPFELSDIERILFGLKPPALQALESLVSLGETDRQFFRYRYLDRLAVGQISERIFTSPDNLRWVRRRVLTTFKKQVFS
jgi:hypothetical protein